MNISVAPTGLNGSIAAPASKSASHRALICAAFADKPTLVRITDFSRDIAATERCLTALGAEISAVRDGVNIFPIKKRACGAVLDCGESGSTLRFLLPVAAAAADETVFSGSGRLPERPIAGLLDSLKRRGVRFSSDRLPFTVSGRLTGGDFDISGEVSSQYISGLLFALPLLETDSSINITSPLVSATYVDMTVDMLGRFGVTVHKRPDGYSVPGGRRYRSPSEIAVEGDWSNAAAFLAAGAISGSVTVSGLSEKSLQGDRAVLGILKRMGASVGFSGDSAAVSSGALKGTVIDMEQTPDLLPVLAVVAACADGRTEFMNVSRQRFKESDRLSATAALISSLGGKAEISGDTLTVYGGGLYGGEADSCGDHRLVMAAAVASCACEKSVTVLGAESVNKSYPRFFDDLITLGGDIRVV